MGVNWLTKQLIKRKWTHRWMVPLSKWYATKMGYRQLGLKLEDLLPEESEVMQLALKRLPPKEAYDRVFRLRRAFQLSLSHQILPESQWTTYEEDTAYLSPIVDEIEAEMAEREDLESIVVRKTKEIKAEKEGTKQPSSGTESQRY